MYWSIILCLNCWAFFFLTLQVFCLCGLVEGSVPLGVGLAMEQIVALNILWLPCLSLTISGKVHSIIHMSIPLIFKSQNSLQWLDALCLSESSGWQPTPWKARPTWTLWWVPSHPRLQKKTLSQNKQTKQTLNLFVLLLAGFYHGRISFSVSEGFNFPFLQHKIVMKFYIHK